MSLDNLIGKTLEKIEPDAVVIKRLLASAERNISDSHIMQLSNAALQANGFRTLTSKPGHHMTMIQVLSQTIGLDKQTVIVLDALRKQRNVADYSGDIVPASAVNECVKHAEDLLHDVIHWLKMNKPNLIK